MRKLNDEETITVLKTMLKICGLCKTEKEAVANAIVTTEWKQDVESIINDLYDEKELVSRKKLPCKIFEILLTAAHCSKYGSKKFRLGEKIYYTPTEIVDILERAIEEGDL